jgi:hypothetical protein
VAPVPMLLPKSWMVMGGMGMTSLGDIPRFLGLGPNSTLLQQNEQTGRSVKDLEGSDLAPPVREGCEDTARPGRVPRLQGFQALPKLAGGSVFE